MREELSKKTLAAGQLSVTVDRELLRQAIAGLARPGDAQDWCVACGAGKSSSPLEKIETVQVLARDVLGGKSLAEFVAGLKDLGKQAWCVACGAGKSASPFDRIGDPAEISDELIDQLAGRLISAVQIG
jgi:ferredoxin